MYLEKLMIDFMRNVAKDLDSWNCERAKLHNNLKTRTTKPVEMVIVLCAFAIATACQCSRSSICLGCNQSILTILKQRIGPDALFPARTGHKSRSECSSSDCEQ